MRAALVAIDERDVIAIGLKRGKEERVVVRQSGGENGGSGEQVNHWMGRGSAGSNGLEEDCVNRGEESL
jgi:hypothetical protein